MSACDIRTETLERTVCSQDIAAGPANRRPCCRSPSVAHPPRVGGCAQFDIVLGGIGFGGLLDDRTQQRPIGSDPVGHDLPLRAVPLLEGHAAVALMVVPCDIDRMEQVLGAELGDTALIEAQMFESPAYFVASQSACAE